MKRIISNYILSFALIGIFSSVCIANDDIPINSCKLISSKVVRIELDDKSWITGTLIKSSCGDNFLVIDRIHKKKNVFQRIKRVFSFNEDSDTFTERSKTYLADNTAPISYIKRCVGNSMSDFSANGYAAISIASYEQVFTQNLKSVWEGSKCKTRVCNFSVPTFYSCAEKSCGVFEAFNVINRAHKLTTIELRNSR